ncbi:gap junction beta-2 protein-like [Clavelina lepadiformis]|uniref:gap junction beta-2 protein-like n=1 Tax=Clavelina lepadiformis TaxID=159417 RepID=UPI00404164C9
MGWHIVQKLVEGTGQHSTLTGKYWITSFFVLRFLIVISLAKSTWSDAQGNFVCNTESPGCKNVCFNEFSPIAPTRYWAFQLLAVSIMTIVFNVYTTHKLALITKAIRKKRKWKSEQKQKAMQLKELANKSENAVGKNEVKPNEPKKDEDKDDEVVATKLQEDHPSKLFLAYFFMVLFRLLVEIAFMVGQYNLYTFKFVVPELWKCQHWPCPNVVDCFVSRPKEKTIMLCTFYATGCIMIMLNIIELYHIGGNFSKAWKTRHQDVTKEVFGDEAVPVFDGAAGGVRAWGPGAEGVYEAAPTGYPDAVGIPMLYTRYTNPRGRKSGLRRNRYNDEYMYT